VNFHYWQIGSGPDLVMLHGLGGNLAVWHFAIAARLRHLYRVTTYDLRGHGRSDMPDTGYTTRQMADDLLGVLDALQIEKTYLLGHSFGADVSLHFSLLHPDRVDKLIVIDAMLPVMLASYQRDDWEGWSYWAYMLKQITGIDVPRDKWQDIPYMMDLSLKVPVLFGPFRGRQRNRAPVTQLLTQTSIVQDFNTIDELTIENLAQIALPTLLIYEQNSPFLETQQALTRQLPDCTPVFLADGALRHFSPLEQPDEILMHVKSFLQPSEVKVPAAITER
jgi:pimeloyl-ACP methyl ester carboxylesterase